MWLISSNYYVEHGPSIHISYTMIKANWRERERFLYPKNPQQDK